MRRREFLRLGAQTSGALGIGTIGKVADSKEGLSHASGSVETPLRFNGTYENAALANVLFPMGGLGAGMIGLEGAGGLSGFSLWNRPDLTTQHRIFAAISRAQSPAMARVLEGPVPTWKLRPQFPGKWEGSTPNTCWGLPRFREARFEAKFPFANIRLQDDAVPLDVALTGWSPFAPGDADNASLPVACLEYQFVNRHSSHLDLVFSFHTENFMGAPQDPANPQSNPNASDSIRATTGGFILRGMGSEGRPADEGQFAAWVEEPDVRVDRAWFRGETFDQMRKVWDNVMSGRTEARNPEPNGASPGASLFVPFRIAAGESRTIALHMAWFVPNSDLFEPNFRFKDFQYEHIQRTASTYRPWYAGRFSGIEDVKVYWRKHCKQLRDATQKFTQSLFDSTLPPEVMEAVAANLSILKSPTILRQPDGRIWGWEGCNDEAGSCYGSSNHVWNYAQAIPHLFPQLERSLRETELGPNLGNDGFQATRTALPIRPIGDTREDGYGNPAAADGQLGGIIKVYREWRISGDTEWLRQWWPKVRLSLDYCIQTWDPEHRGWIQEGHLNTYDVEFWGPDSLCTTLYLGALKAAVLIGEALEDHHNAKRYRALLEKSARQTGESLFNGEYFYQKTDWTHLRRPFTRTNIGTMHAMLREYPDILESALAEGPPYQYGTGCLSDGVLGAWLCMVSGIDELIDRRKVESHLLAVYRYNFKRSLASHVCQFRALFACGEEAGLLVGSWPKGGRPTLPLFYADEVWTGIEYQVASHLIALGKIAEGLEIVRACRSRYDGRVRNPFSEVEAGHWYARAMSSYALLQAFTGARFDAVEKVLYLRPVIRGDFRCFLSTATGFGTVGVANGQPFLEVAFGEIPYKEIRYQAA